MINHLDLGLILMAFGMAGIFSVLVVFMLVIKLLVVLFPEKNSILMVKG